MSTRELVVLGTSGQCATRARNQNGYAVRWDDQLLLFDPGEGFHRQSLLAGLSVAKATALFITHFHGDHCLGLPGLVHRRQLDQTHSPLPLFHPAPGADPLQHLLEATEPDHTGSDLGVGLELHPIAGDGVVDTVGELTVSAAALDHTVPTLGYRLQEPPSSRLDGARLAEAGITGPSVAKLMGEGHLMTAAGDVDLAAFSLPRPGQAMAFVMDTAMCDGALELAADVDLLVCEATYLEADADLARDHRHLTAREAGWLAREAGARRLVLTHFSARYDDIRPFAEEAGELHGDVVLAVDLQRIPVPARLRIDEDDEGVPFRPGQPPGVAR